MSKMDFEAKEISIRELVKDYIDNEEDGVFGYSGKLNIRPPYQRELVYGEDEQRDVINSVMNDYPLNVMYWMVNSDGTYEMLDGQQRTLSICRYYDNKYSVLIDGYSKKFFNLSEVQKKSFLDYKLLVYFCKGSIDERKKWFKIINYKGQKLTDQEMLNAMYSGEWVTDAKRYFSKTNCAAYRLGNDFLYNKRAIRQEILETVLKWASDLEGITIDEYMANHQNDTSAKPLWLYFKNIIEWIKYLFGCTDDDESKYRSEMKKVDWGTLYNKYKDNKYDIIKLQQEVDDLMADSNEVGNKIGIYTYVFDREEKHLQLRQFDDVVKRSVFEQQKHKCFICGKEKKFEEMHGDHWVPWKKGGKTVIENCKMLCARCNLKKSSQEM